MLRPDVEVLALNHLLAHEPRNWRWLLGKIRQSKAKFTTKQLAFPDLFRLQGCWFHRFSFVSPEGARPRKIPSWRMALRIGAGWRNRASSFELRKMSSVNRQVDIN